MREGDVRMKSFNPLVIIPCVLLGVLLGFIASGALHEEAENKVKTSIECIAEEGTDVFGEHYAIAGVVDEYGSCIELLDTAPEIIGGKTVELAYNEDGYTTRVVDLDGDGRVDKYDKADKAGNIVLRIFRDLKTGKVYSVRSDCTTPERFIDGLIANLEDSTVLDSYNDILKNPGKHGYRSISISK